VKYFSHRPHLVIKPGIANKGQQKFLNHKLPPLLALTGLLLIAIGFVSAFIGYNQSIDINYSPLNHFVSELGWERVNNSAWAFNYAIAVSGLMFLPLAWAMGRNIGTKLGWISTAVSIVTLLSGSMIGVVPLDRRFGPRILWTGRCGTWTL
jgi:cytochrome bd-type quinol oxidase subunit 1